MRRKTEIVWLILLFVFSFALRVYKLRTNELFINSDEAATLLGVLDLFHIFDVLSLKNAVFYLYRMYVFPYSYVFIIFNFLIKLIYSLFNISLTEFTHVLPATIVGSFVPILAYFLAKELQDYKAGIIAGLFIAALPMTVFISRFNAGTTHLGVFFLTLTMLTFVRYFKNQTKKSALFASTSLAIYIGTEHQFAAIFPLIFYIGLTLSKGNYWQRTKIVLTKLITPRMLIIPLIVTAPLFITWGYMIIDGGRYDEGHFGHMFTKKTELNFYPDAIRDVIYSTGLIITLLFAISIPFGLKKIITLDKKSIPFVCAILYLAPWFFLLQFSLLHRLYYTGGLISATIFVSIIFSELHNQIKQKTIKIVLTILTAITLTLTLATTLNYVYGINTPLSPIIKEGFMSDVCPGLNDNVCDFPKNYCYIGSTIKNNSNWGLKTAGYYIRETTKCNANIFTETGTPAAKYYFHRKIFNNEILWMYSTSNITEKYKLLKPILTNVSAVVVRNCNEKIAAPFLNNNFFKNVEIRSEGKPVLYIYTKNKQQLQIMDTETYDPLFDKKYGKWQELYAENWIYHNGFY